MKAAAASQQIGLFDDDEHQETPRSHRKAQETPFTPEPTPAPHAPTMAENAPPLDWRDSLAGYVGGWK